MGVIGGTGSTRKCTFGFSLPPPHLMQILGRVNITVFYWWGCRLTELEMEKRLGNKGLIKFNSAVLQMLTYRPRKGAWVAQGNIAWEWKGWAPCNVSWLLQYGSYIKTKTNIKKKPGCLVLLYPHLFKSFLLHQSSPSLSFKNSFIYWFSKCLLRHYSEISYIQGRVRTLGINKG